MYTATVVIPDALVLDLEPYRSNLDDLLCIGLREVKKEQGLALFKKGDVSLWKAARLAGISLREMTEYATAQGLRASLEDDMIEEKLT